MTGSRKPPTRLYVDAPLDSSSLVLEAERAHYLGRVLRCREGDEIVVFNSRGAERSAVIESLAKRRPVIALGTPVDPLPDPNTPILLLQALVKSDAMDLIVQKATELGVASIYATKTDFSVVRLDQERQGRRLEHWRRIATSSCEQCGRHRPPDFQIFKSLDQAIAALPADSTRIAFDTTPAIPLNAIADRGPGISLAIGPEGGFSPDESQTLAAAGFAIHSLGPRILRAETAAIAAVVSAQILSGERVNGSR
jgi:16S rRNA (uracil1498-N3)-methyltransferase